MCKKISAEFLMQRSSKYFLAVPIENQPNCYGDWDFEILYTGKPNHVETEHKLGWISTDGTFLVTSEKYPEGRIYSTVDVSERKKKSKADIFIMCNRTYDALCMTEMKNVLEANQRNKDTRIGTRNEPFFKVEKTLFKFYISQNGIWQCV
jgi:hypothetical protein